MKILIVDAIVRPNSGGVLSILNDVYQFACSDEENDYYFLIGYPDLLKPKQNVHIIFDKRFQKKYSGYVYRLAFDSLLGSKLASKIGCDRIVSLQNTAILHTAIPQMLYVHQPLPFARGMKFNPLVRSERKLFFYKNMVGCVIKFNLRFFHNGAVTVQTQWIKDAVSHFFKGSIYINKPTISLDTIQGLKRGLPVDSFFYPSTAMKYKNHLRLVQAYSTLPEKVKEDLPLLLTISQDEFEKVYKTSITDSHVHFLGRILRKEVLNITQHSILVFPSKLETLGLPLLESMALSRPIIASNIPPVVEIVNDYTNRILFNPDSTSQIKEALLKGSTLVPTDKEYHPTQKISGWVGFFNQVLGLKEV